MSLEHDKSKLRVAREVKQNIYTSKQTPSYAAAPMQQMPTAALSGTSSVSTANNTSIVEEEKGEVVTSPMVGTVYLAPDPESPPFVKVGDTIKKGQTIMIVEAMKVMNNIPSPISGTVQAIKINDKEPVEFGQTLAIIS